MIGELDSLDWLRWADVKYPDIDNYFIATPRVTKQQLKAYKSMDSVADKGAQVHKNAP